MNDYEKIDFCFKINLQISNSKEYDDYSDDYFSYISSPIIYKKLDENYETIESNEIGEIQLIYIHGTRAINNELDIVDICDAESQALYDYVCRVYKNGYISDKLNDFPSSNDLLILDIININTAYQGREYGLIISKKMIDFFGSNCGGIMIKPFLLQFSVALNDEEKLNLKYKSEKFSSDLKTARNKIMRYWKRLSPHCKTLTINGSEKVIYIPN